MREFKPLPSQPAPSQTVGPLAWVRENLFDSIPSSIVTIVVSYFLVVFSIDIVNWGILSATFEGTTQDACMDADGAKLPGACWVFVSAWSQQFWYGSFPEDEIWRVNLTLVLLLVVIILSFVLPKAIRLKFAVVGFLLLPFVGMAILDGRALGLDQVKTDLWGGFSLNVLMAAASIIVAFPFSFLWALGRRSDMAFIRSVSVIFIEFFRGVPVLSLFFMGSVMLPLFFAEGTNVDKLIRVWIVLIFFMSGYMAEVFRGGFQAIPQGQYEAADSLGLGYWQKTLLILLPQVIKVSMPNILATFVMLFKNTTFLLIIGIPELVQTLQTALSNSYWLGGHTLEGYLFVFAVFWVSCFSMSLIAASIERKLDTSHRN